MGAEKELAPRSPDIVVVSKGADSEGVRAASRGAWRMEVVSTLTGSRVA